MSPEDLPPQNLDAEKAVLGAVMASKSALSDVSEILSPADFYMPTHGQVFAACLSLFSDGTPVDAVTVADEMRRRGQLDKAGGPVFLLELVQSAPVVSNALAYAEIVKDKAQARALIETCTSTLLAARKGADTLEALDSHEKALFAISTAAVKDEGTKASDGIAARVARRLSGEKRDTGLSTGFSDLDRIIGGLRPGELAIIGARPSIGKSTLALDLARHVALDNHSPVAFFSLEMTEDEIWDRIIAAEASVPLKKVRGDEDLDDDEITAVLKTADRAQNCALTVYDKASVNVPEIKAKCRRHKKKNGLALVVVDYIQLLTTMGKNMESRQVEVSEFSRQMKLLAKELNVPVIVCAQLNRLTEQQGPVTKTNSAGETVKVTPPPKLSHLRESGSLEQDADLVILLHRDDFYDKNVRPGEADLIVAKHRNGPTGTVTVASQLHYSRFANMAAEA